MRPLHGAGAREMDLQVHTVPHVGQLAVNCRPPPRATCFDFECGATKVHLPL